MIYDLEKKTQGFSLIVMKANKWVNRKDRL